MNQKPNIYFVRHGQTDNNVNGIIIWGDDNQNLNKLWVSKAHNFSKNIPLDIKFDIIISSPLSRAKNTAEIIKSNLNYDVQIIENKDLIEQIYWEFKWMSFDEISKKYNIETKEKLQELYRNNSTESLENFVNRVSNGYNAIKNNCNYNNILIVAHWWTLRVINKIIYKLNNDETFYVPWTENLILYKINENSILKI